MRMDWITGVRIIIYWASRPPGRKPIAINGDLYSKFPHEL
jgi:hypothetical protein